MWPSAVAVGPPGLPASVLGHIIVQAWGVHHSLAGGHGFRRTAREPDTSSTSERLMASRSVCNCSTVSGMPLSKASTASARNRSSKLTACACVASTWASAAPHTRSKRPRSRTERPCGSHATAPPGPQTRTASATAARPPPVSSRSSAHMLTASQMGTRPVVSLHAAAPMGVWSHCSTATRMARWVFLSGAATPASGPAERLGASGVGAHTAAMLPCEGWGG
mmetsp:Transcript_43400/g.138077  ORF Transcript_43400/g.138077 Transcript_43400/m.138077 type:complete len:222 (-) Transcript_43400:72-737(-)